MSVGLAGPAADLSRVRAVVVSWNSEGLVGRAAASVPAPARVVVVDNASKDGSASEAERSGAVVVRLGENTGFGPACNVGAGEVAQLDVDGRAVGAHALEDHVHGPGVADLMVLGFFVFYGLQW